MLDFRSLQLATASLAEALDAAKTLSDDMYPVKASRVFAMLPAFLENARSLLTRLMAAGG